MRAPEVPTRRSALAGAYRAGEYPAAGRIGVSFELRTGLHVVMLRGMPIPGEPVLPAAPNTAVDVPGGELMWVGPQEWLLCTNAPVPALVARWPEGATDVSHGSCVLRIGGSAVRDLLCGGISLDLHPAAFAAGCSARTLYAGVGVLLYRLRESERFDLHVPRSHARHVWELLQEAAAQWGYRAD